MHREEMRYKSQATKQCTLDFVLNNRYKIYIATETRYRYNIVQDPKLVFFCISGLCCDYDGL